MSIRVRLLIRAFTHTLSIHFEQQKTPQQTTHPSCWRMASALARWRARGAGTPSRFAHAALPRSVLASKPSSAAASSPSWGDDDERRGGGCGDPLSGDSVPLPKRADSRAGIFERLGLRVGGEG